MALIKIKTTDIAESDIICDVDFPLVLTAVAVDRFTMAITHPSLSTVLVQWQTNLASVATTTLVANQELNAAYEAGIADPYHVPVFSGMDDDGTPHPLISYTLA